MLGGFGRKREATEERRDERRAKSSELQKEAIAAALKPSRERNVNTDAEKKALTAGPKNFIRASAAAISRAAGVLMGASNSQ